MRRRELLPRSWRTLTLALVSSFAFFRAGEARAAEDDPSAATERGSPYWDPWSDGRVRTFVAARVDAGIPFAQARGSVGYGKPHYFWGGFEAGPIASVSALAGFAGLRFEHPIIDVRTDLLFVSSFRRDFLPARNSYDRRDIDDVGDEKARYLTWDSEARLRIPLWGGFVQSETQSVFLGDHEGRYVYVDTLRVVAAPNWVLRERLAYEFPVSAIFGLRVGPALETVWSVERDDGLVWRAGAVFRWWLFHDLELRIDVLPVVASPDSLGNLGGEPLRAALRYQWATGAHAGPSR